jgi:hypothetical protein
VSDHIITLTSKCSPTDGAVNPPVITCSLTDVSSDYNVLQSPRQQIDVMLDLNAPADAPQGAVFRSRFFTSSHLLGLCG